MATVVERGTTLDPLQIRQVLGISQERMSTLLRVSTKTISRWETEHRQPPHPEHLTRLAKLKEIAELGRSVYTLEGFKEFLATLLPVFEGRTGFDLMQLGDYEVVIGALAADFEGTGF